MVVFTCDTCNDALKKPKVRFHGCRNTTFTCIDCHVTFTRFSFERHNKCITEKQRYGGVDYVAKLSKNEMNQQKYQQQLAGAVNFTTGMVKNFLMKMSHMENVPRKKKPFLNFCKSSVKIESEWVAEQVYDQLQVALKRVEEKEAREANELQQNNEEEEKMVVFTCDTCNDALKKPKVRFHGCRNATFTCVDCHVTFTWQTFDKHNKCITEKERYGGVDYVPKVNKNETKQQQYSQHIAEAINFTTGMVKNFLMKMSHMENVPRKKKPFINFCKNAVKIQSEHVAEQVFDQLQAAIKRVEEKEAQEANKQEINEEEKVGEQEDVEEKAEESKEKRKKRKREEEEATIEVVEVTEAKKKKKKNKDKEEQVEEEPQEVEKKKKKKRRDIEEEALEEPLQEAIPKKKKKKRQEIPEDIEKIEEIVDDEVSERKKKKKKKRVHDEQEEDAVVEEVVEEVPEKKKKKKKREQVNEDGDEEKQKNGGSYNAFHYDYSQSEANNEEEKPREKDLVKGWSTRIAAITNSDTKRNKFEKLLGMHKNGTQKVDIDQEEVKRLKDDYKEMKTKMDQQYDRGQKFTHKTKGKGL